MKNLKIKLNLAKFTKKVLTFLLRYAKMILEVYWYSGIVVYFGSQKSKPKNGILDYPDKKQKQKNGLNLANLSPNRAGLLNFSQKNQLLSGLFGPAHDGLDQSAVVVSAIIEAEKSNILLYFVLTFCFFVETFFCYNFVWKAKVEYHKSRYSAFGENRDPDFTSGQNQKQNYDRRPLSATRLIARNRQKQNHADSLGRRGINSQGPERQPRLALLYPRTSGRNYSASQRNQLLPPGAWRLQTKLKRNCWAFNYFNPAGVSLLSFLISQKYVLAETKSKYLLSLENKTNENFGFKAFWPRQKDEFKYLTNNLQATSYPDYRRDKLKAKKYDCWLLPLTRYPAENRSQQNHADSLGRRGINSQGPERQPGLALLYSRTSGRNYSAGSKNQLLQKLRTKEFRLVAEKIFSRINQALTQAAKKQAIISLD